MKPSDSCQERVGSELPVSALLRPHSPGRTSAAPSRARTAFANFLRDRQKPCRSQAKDDGVNLEEHADRLFF